MLIDIPLFFIFFKDLKRYAYNITDQILDKAAVPLSPFLVWNAIFLGGIVFFWLTVIYRTAFIYFFTRPAVKEEFKRGRK